MIRHIVEPISQGSKEAQSRIKINKLLEEAGWRFEPNEKGITTCGNDAFTSQKNLIIA